MGVAPSHDDIPPRPNVPSSWKEEAQIPQNSAKTFKPAWKEETQLPHNCNEILNYANSPVDRSSMTKLYEQLYAGVYLGYRKSKKYWVDRECKSNCFTLFPRDLKILNGMDARLWRWLPWREPSTGESFQIAELLKISCLGIYGRLEMAYLSPGTNYEVVFVVKLTESAYDWEGPLDVKLTLPNGTTLVYAKSLEKMPREQWIEIRTLAFKASGIVGGMKASIEKCDYGKPIIGLIIKWVIIKPKAA